MNKLSKHYAEDWQQEACWADEIAEAERDGKVVAVCVSWRADQGIGFARVLGSREQLFVQRRQMLTPGVGVGKYFRCRPRPSSRLRTANEIEFYADREAE